MTFGGDPYMGGAGGFDPMSYLGALGGGLGMYGPNRASGSMLYNSGPALASALPTESAMAPWGMMGVPVSAAGATVPMVEGAAGAAATAAPWLMPSLRAAGPYALGGAGASMIGHLLDTQAGGKGAESGIGRFLEGAGVGAPIGAFVGNALPIPGVGAGVGALVGGAAGGLWSLFGGSSSNTPSKADILKHTQSAVDSALSTLAGSDPNTAALLTSQYRPLYDAASSDDERMQVLKGTLQSAVQNIGISQQRSGAYTDASQLLTALQNYQGAHADTANKQFYKDELARAGYMNQLAGKLDPSQQAYAHYLVQQQLEQAAQTIAANQQQLTALPYVLAMQMQQGLGQQFAPMGLYGAQTATPTTGTAPTTGTSGINLAQILAQAQQPTQ